MEEHERSTLLRAFLREHRARISPRDAGLPERPGRRLAGLSAEDVAELIGVSTRWYLHFEEGQGGRRVSLRFLERLVGVLRLDAKAKITLYRLAFHEVDAAAARLERDLRSAALKAQARAVIEAFGSMRRVVRRLWAASSETEALTVATEAIAARFGDPDFIGSHIRAAPGAWQFPTTIASEHIQQKVQTAFSHILRDLTAEQIDELMLGRVLIEPGQAGTKSQLFKDFRMGPLIDRGFERAGLPNTEFAIVHVRSQRGFEANLFAATLARPRAFSDIELAELSTLGDFTSFALS